MLHASGGRLLDGRRCRPHRGALGTRAHGISRSPLRGTRRQDPYRRPEQGGLPFCDGDRGARFTKSSLCSAGLFRIGPSTSARKGRGRICGISARVLAWGRLCRLRKFVGRRRLRAMPFPNLEGGGRRGATGRARGSRRLSGLDRVGIPPRVPPFAPPWATVSAAASRLTRLRRWRSSTQRTVRSTGYFRRSPFRSGYDY